VPTRSAGADDFDTTLGQPPGKINDSQLVADTNQRPSYFRRFHFVRPVSTKTKNHFALICEVAVKMTIEIVGNSVRIGQPPIGG
jgi:hypothetical protein